MAVDDLTLTAGTNITFNENVTAHTLTITAAGAGGAQTGEWTFNATTTAPPSSGQIRLDAVQASATKMYISNNTATGIDAATMLKFAVTNAAKLLLQEKDNAANYASYTVNGTPIVQSGYLEVPLTLIESGGTISVQRCILFVQQGVVASATVDWASVTGKPATFPPTLPIAQAGVTNLTTDLAAKEPTIAVGTTGQYWRGDKSWQTLDKTSVGLGNVDNTADTAKPVSTAQQTALNAKEPTVAVGTTGQYWRGDKSWINLDKTVVGLGNVDNTADSAKPVSTAQQTALNLKLDKASNLSDVATPATAFNNIKQPATLAGYMGVVDGATDAMIRAATAGSHGILAMSLESAAAWVIQAYAATLTIDWKAAINFQYNGMSGNSVLGNPTNGIVGTYRTIWVAGNSATPRTLTFASGFHGTIPTLTDITNAKQYLLTLFCVDNATPIYLVTSIQLWP